MTELTLSLKIDSEQEIDGRWIAEVKELPGVLAYGETESLAVSKAKVLALRVIADQIAQDLEDEEDLEDAIKALEDAGENETVSWKSIKADLGL